MVRSGGKRENNGETVGGRARGTSEDVDALFKLSLAEFIGARNTLAAQLKKSGRTDEANLVKALAKPSISAWAVNQLYWNHRDAFDGLLASGQRFHQAQTSGFTGKAADMRGLLETRRQALAQLTDLATSLLRDAGHNPTWDTVRRITTTLEAISANASLPDGPIPGRLTHDIEPPGFDSLASMIASAGATAMPQKPVRPKATEKSAAAATSQQQKSTPARDVRALEETRQARIAAAKVSLQDAKRSLSEARARAQRLEAAQKKADAEAKEVEKQRRKAEEQFKQASAAAETAAQRAKKMAYELHAASELVEDAKRMIEKAAKELESLKL